MHEKHYTVHPYFTPEEIYSIFGFDPRSETYMHEEPCKFKPLSISLREELDILYKRKLRKFIIWNTIAGSSIILGFLYIIFA